MKIIHLMAENVKRIRAVEITPDANLVEITGRNGAGKTSVLDSIWWALGGTKSHQSVPIRNGEQEAEIRLDLEDIVVHRKFIAQRGGGTRTQLSVRGADGTPVKSPQTMLDSLLGSIAFDPLKFTRMERREQYETLRDLVGLDFAEVNAANKADFETRTEENRRAKESHAAAAAVIVPADCPDEPVDVADIARQMDEAETVAEGVRQQTDARAATHRKIATHIGEADGLQADANQARQRIKGLREEIDRLTAKEQLERQEAERLQEATDALPPVPPLPDTAALRDALRSAQEINAAVDAKDRKNAFLKAAKAHDQRSKELTVAIDARKADVTKQIEQAKMPIEGLGIEHGQVTWGGLPFDQASDAEQLRASCAIAMQGDHKLRVIRVRDGSLLDSGGLDVLKAMAKEHDYQIWIERVDDTGQTGIVIEDGEVLQ